MSAKYQRMRIPPEFDRRRKLSDEDRKEIWNSYHNLGMSGYALARLYGVSRRTITLIVNPDSYTNFKAYRREYARRHKQPKDYLKKHLAYKRKLYKEGKLIFKEDDC